ncbi:hypothetical protein L596_030060 [Steinernema carpocapsae]|uniref:Serpin domain-containing protein n=1 Tax=Steinernema carpocapsae TaxID=34508 RepID=A0A4U5LRM2_STECR|nr:hypothetical protein L596_030060 [Steinernema carpocapsae]
MPALPNPVREACWIEIQENTYTLPLSLASAIYLQETLELLDKYQTDLAQNFDTKVEKLDFSNNPDDSRAVINKFVSEATQKEIPELLKNKDVTEDTKIVIVNAMYLKAAFAQAFSEELTQEEAFNNEDGSVRQVQMMSDAKKGNFYENDDFAYAEISFLEYGFSFFFLVPKNGALSELKEKLATPDLFSSALSNASYIPTIHMAIPKFKIDVSYDLKDALQRLGINELFDKRSNLSGIIEGPLKVGNVIHQGVFDLGVTRSSCHGCYHGGILYANDL